MTLARFFAAAVSSLLKYSLGGLIAILALSWNLTASAADIVADESIAQACLDSNAFQEPEETLQRCEAALKLASATAAEKAKFHLQRGLVFHWADRAYLAIPEFDKALQLDSSLWEALEKRGRAHANAQQYGLAYRDFIDVLSEDPRNADALFGLANLYYGTSRHEYSVHLLEQALEIKPDHYIVRFRLAHHFANWADDPERALEEYKLILSAAPGVLEAIPFKRNPPPEKSYNFRYLVEGDQARALMKVKRFAEAFALLNLQVKEFPGDAYLTALRGLASFVMDDLEAAAADAERSVKLNAAVLDGQSLRMKVLFELQRYDEALEAANATISLSSREPPTYRHAVRTRAIIHKKRKEIAQAKADFEQVIRMGGAYRTDVIMRLKELNYYSGGPHDEYNMAMSNGLDACLIDPECYK